MRVVTLIGARQVGKSSLAKQLASSERPYVSLDELPEYILAQRDPTGFISRLPRFAIIDEIQRLPELLSPIKVSVDNDTERGRYLLTGSANILALPQTADSLAGRMAIQEMFPLAQVEIDRVDGNVIDLLFEAADTGEIHPKIFWGLPPVDLRDLIARVVRGGYPDIVLEPDQNARDEWFGNYLLSLIQRDMRDIANITDVAGMARLLRILAIRSGRILNLSTLASEAELAKSTLVRYMTLLEQTLLVQRIPAWRHDVSRRLVVAPKIVFGDSGVTAYESQLTIERLLDERASFGPLLETFVANELRKHASWSKLRPDMYHYRSNNGLEVDFILEARNGTRIAIEVKGTQTLRRDETESIAEVVNDPKLGITYGIVLHAGTNHVMQMGPKILAVPLSLFWAQPKV